MNLPHTDLTNPTKGRIALLAASGYAECFRPEATYER